MPRLPETMMLCVTVERFNDHEENRGVDSLRKNEGGGAGISHTHSPAELDLTRRQVKYDAGGVVALAHEVAAPNVTKSTRGNTHAVHILLGFHSLAGRHKSVHEPFAALGESRCAP